MMLSRPARGAPRKDVKPSLNQIMKLLKWLVQRLDLVGCCLTCALSSNNIET
jgi:hypothetical protein